MGNTGGIQVDRIIEWAVRMVIDENRNICKYFGTSFGNHIGVDRPVSTEHGTKEVMVVTHL